MDSLIAASARALATGDVLTALKHVALRDDPPALALRGIAMAQLGDLARARELLRRAQRGFGAHEVLARARCGLAEAEVALALRELGGNSEPLSAIATVLEAQGDAINALQAWLILARRMLLLGKLDDAAHALAKLEGRQLPPALSAMADLTAATLALRRMQIAQARGLLERARMAAAQAGVGALQAEVDQARIKLDQPAARCLGGGVDRLLRIDQVQQLLDSGALIVDGCQRGIRFGASWQSLARRPVLFALACALAEAWPGEVDRDVLIRRAFGMRHYDETLRARLRVEISRLRGFIAMQAHIEATAAGFRLSPRSANSVRVLLPPIEGEQGALLALLADGAAWSTSALGLALGQSQRNAQRALLELEAAGRVYATGRGRAQRWRAVPLGGFTTILLLPAALPID
ncbi:helix-turn-helix domain-containing protein [Stenotrophomonas pigmentata]|uniref:helix-turn-helix domain-containing protein n=1 Tax=Stenotrophomonas pigmentata TaxID=3055080 RepID=UPI0026EA477A|nr:helix-turn-helix domain-containing protein [Stenotrophomonas sp. 610A2]